MAVGVGVGLGFAFVVAVWPTAKDTRKSGTQTIANSMYRYINYIFGKTDSSVKLKKALTAGDISWLFLFFRIDFNL